MEGYYSNGISLTAATIQKAINSLENNKNNSCLTSYGDGIKTNMKESNKTRFQINFTKTVVTEYYYDILAESEEDALKKIEQGTCCNDIKTVSEIIVRNK